MHPVALDLFAFLFRHSPFLCASASPRFNPFCLRMENRSFYYASKKTA